MILHESSTGHNNICPVLAAKVLKHQGSHHRSFLSFQIDNLQVASLQRLLPEETDEMGLIETWGRLKYETSLGLDS